MTDDLIKRLRTPMHVTITAGATELDDYDEEREEAADRIEQLEAERDAWVEAARLHCAGESTFFEWLREAGEHMRDVGVTIRDDGVDSGEILTAKVPECAALLKARAEAAEAKLATVDAGVLRGVEAGYTKALAEAESWIHDQLDGTGQVDAALADLDASRNALTDLRAIMGKLK